MKGPHFVWESNLHEGEHKYFMEFILLMHCNPW